MTAAIPPPPTDRFELGPFTVHIYGILIAIGVIVALAVARRRFAAVGGDPDLVDRIGLRAVLLGFVGARLAYVSTHLDRFDGRPWAVLFIWEGGLALFGGLTLGVLTAWWLARRWNVPIPAFADAAAPAIPLAQAIGRWGNYFNQELYGTPTDLPWALEVEPAYRVAPYEAFSTFHPTFLYESLLNLALAALIIRIGRARRLARGSLFLVYLAGYGLIRFLVELLRTDTTFRLLGLSRNNWVALLVCAGAGAALVVWQRRGPAARTEEPLATPATQPLTENPGQEEAGP